MVELQPSKLVERVQFPSPAPVKTFIIKLFPHLIPPDDYPKFSILESVLRALDNRLCLFWTQVNCYLAREAEEGNREEGNRGQV